MGGALCSMCQPQPRERPDWSFALLLLLLLAGLQTSCVDHTLITLLTPYPGRILPPGKTWWCLGPSGVKTNSSSTTHISPVLKTPDKSLPRKNQVPAKECTPQSHRIWFAFALMRGDMPRTPPTRCSNSKASTASCSLRMAAVWLTVNSSSCLILYTKAWFC